MFLKTSDFAVSSLSVFRLGWNAKIASSDIRPYHALSFRVKGHAKFIHNDTVITAETGDIVFVPAHHPYTLDCGEEEVIVIHFTTKALMPDTIKRFSSEASRFYERYFTELYHAWTRKQLGFEHECRYLFHKIVMQLERDASSTKLKSANAAVLRSIDYIHDHFTDPALTVAHLAADCNMSETYYRKLFIKYCKVTPLQYINTLKLQRAVELLSSKYYTVSEVAAQCGFANPYYCSTLIKRETGRSPSEFIQI